MTVSTTIQPVRLAAPLWVLAPAIVTVPVVLLLPGIIHAGGSDLLAGFVLAAARPSLDPVVLRSLLHGLGMTLGMALLGWATSLLGGLVLGWASARVVWQGLVGHEAPAQMLRRLLAVPRSIHELLWGLALLQLVGFKPSVAVMAIAIPYSALVARVVSDLLDALPRSRLQALQAGGASAPVALITALGPPLLPQMLSYGGYRLECALRSATLLGVFGLGGLGGELRLTLQSLAFHELWSGLWLLLAVMVLLEQLVGHLRQRWSMPVRLGLARQGVGHRGRELVLGFCALVPVLTAVASAMGLRLQDFGQWQGLPPTGAADWVAVAALPWPALIGQTLLMTLMAAALAVGCAPLLLLIVEPWSWGRWLLRGLWALGRLWPPPLTAMLLLFVLKPGILTGALALGLHNLGILGRLLLENRDDRNNDRQEALAVSGTGARLALLYGCYSNLARSYLAYGAYRTDVILRESVVVGMVGASGLGNQLLEALSAFAYDQLAALVAVYALLTLLGEDLSDRCRRRLLASTN